MCRAVFTGLIYFLLVFTAGFLLGALRTTFLVPAVSSTLAVLAELPIMLLISWYACRIAITRGRPGAFIANRAIMGGFAFFLLIAAETALGLFLFNRDVAAQLAGYGRPAGLLGLIAQLCFALFPLLQGHGER